MVTVRRIRITPAVLRAGISISVCCLGLLGAAGVGATQEHPTAPKPANASCDLTDGEDRTVTRVIDGETLLLDGGTELRLIGALTPRAYDTAGETPDWPIADRARDALETIAAGRTIRLGFAGRRTDRYGRLLAHVFLGAGDERVWLQGELLKQGLARAYALDGNTACLAELVAQETVARENAAGLWAETIYAVRSADDVSTLLRLAGTYQIVEGKVSNAADVRGTLYINFGEDRRQDFTVVVRSQARRALAIAGLKPDDLNGQRIRVRGWIERRGGPLIELPHPDALERLAPTADDADPSGAGAAPASPQTRRRARRTIRKD